MRYIYYKTLHTINILYILIIIHTTQDIAVHYAKSKKKSQLAGGQLKSHIKKCLDLENNMVSHMTALVWLACQLGP